MGPRARLLTGSSSDGGMMATPARVPWLVLILLAMLSAVAWMILSCGHPSDDALIARYHAHRAELEMLVKMATEDGDFTYISTSHALRRIPGSPVPSEGMPDKRWNEYRTLFARTGVAMLSRDSTTTQLGVSSSGLVMAGSSKGFAYSETRLSPIVDSLDKADAVQNGWAYRRIEGNWYLKATW